MLYDDDEIRLSTSSAAYIESPLKAERKALMEKIAKEKLQGPTNTGALTDLKKTVLLSQVSGKKDEEKKRGDRATKKQQSSIGTKTREQEIDERTMTANTKPTLENIVKQDADDRKTEQEIKAQESATEEG